jgi:hypothetical protein
MPEWGIDNGIQYSGKDGRFHMAPVTQGLLLPNMPWDREDPRTSVLMQCSAHRWGSNQTGKECVNRRRWKSGLTEMEGISYITWRRGERLLKGEITRGGASCISRLSISRSSSSWGSSCFTLTFYLSNKTLLNSLFSCLLILYPVEKKNLHPRQ